MKVEMKYLAFTQHIDTCLIYMCAKNKTNEQKSESQTESLTTAYDCAAMHPQIVCFR